MFIDSWQWDKSSSWHASSGVSSVQPPPPPRRMWTLKTQILWQTWKFTSYPCTLSTRQSGTQPFLAPSPFFLPHLSLCLWLFALWLAGPLWSSRSPAVISSWWWWTTSVTAACSSQSPWTPSKSCISFAGQKNWRGGGDGAQDPSKRILVCWCSEREEGGFLKPENYIWQGC